jgi:23S rRNA pseudouridine2605 synthase
LQSVRPRHDDPDLPDEVSARDLPGEARVELKTLSKDNAEWVARHLVMASRLIETDPELAHEHATSAARRAGRIGVVRETLAITAYATGDFALALRELRTYRRISGSNDQLPLMVDSERGVGRPDRALELGRSVDRSTLGADVQVALAIAMSGARLDLEQPEAALAELEIPQLDPNRAFSWSPDLFHAYAEVLEELGRDDQAASWRERAERAEEALADALDFDEHETIDVIEEEILLAPDDTSAAALEAEVDELLAEEDDEGDHAASEPAEVEPAEVADAEPNEVAEVETDAAGDTADAASDTAETVGDTAETAEDTEAPAQADASDDEAKGDDGDGVVPAEH